MSAPVPYLPVIPQATDVSAARVVRGSTSNKIAALLNRVNGNGVQIVPAYFLANSGITLSAGTRYQFQVRVRPTYQNIVRKWQIFATGSGTFTFAAPDSGTDKTLVASPSLDSARFSPPEYFEVRSSKSASNAVVTFEIDNAESALEFYGVSCVEVPRQSLDMSGNDPVTTDAGIDLSELAPNEPILSGDDSASSQQWQRMATAAATWNTTGHRGSLLQWAVPHRAGGSETTSFAFSTTTTSFGGSGSATDIFGLPQSLLMRAKQLSNSTGLAPTTASVNIYLGYKVTGGTGQAKVTATSGATLGPINLTSTSYALLSLGVLAVDTELYTANDGRRATRWDDCTFEVIAGVGQTVYVTAVSVFEP